jgi:hypothetical protein
MDIVALTALMERTGVANIHGDRTDTRVYMLCMLCTMYTVTYIGYAWTRVVILIVIPMEK